MLQFLQPITSKIIYSGSRLHKIDEYLTGLDSRINAISDELLKIKDPKAPTGQKSRIVRLAVDRVLSVEEEAKKQEALMYKSKGLTYETTALKEGSKYYMLMREFELNEIMLKRENYTLYEILTMRQGVKLYFDTEVLLSKWKRDSINKNRTYSIEEYETLMMLELDKFVGKVITTSSSTRSIKLVDHREKNREDYKYSMHVIYPDIIFENYEDLRSTMRKLLETYDSQESEMYTYIDKSVYTLNRCFRLPYQSKIGADSVLHPHAQNVDEPLSSYILQSIPNGVSYSTYNLKNLQQVQEKLKTLPQSQPEPYKLFGEELLCGHRIPLLVDEDDCNMDKVSDILIYIQNYDQPQGVWWRVGAACHQEGEENYEHFLNWTRKYVGYMPTQDSRIRSVWESYKHKTSNYLGIKYLRDLAIFYNPELSKLISDKKYFVEVGLGIGLESFLEPKIYNNRYVLPYNLLSNDTIIEMSQMGTGKTTQILKYLVKMYISNPSSRVCFMSSRVAFAQNIANEFNYKLRMTINENGDLYQIVDSNGLSRAITPEDEQPLYFMNVFESRGLSVPQFTIYNQIEGSLTSVPWIMIQMESLMRLGESLYDLVIMDESESLLTQFLSSTMDNKISSNLYTLQTIVSKSVKLIICDAFISQRSLEMVRNLRDISHVEFRKNTYIIEKREVHYYTSDTTNEEFILPEMKKNNKTESAPKMTGVKKLTKKMLELLSAGKKIYCISSSKDLIHDYLMTISEIKKLQEEKKVLVYSSETEDKLKKETLQNVNKNWSNVQLILATSSITVGISYDKLDFDYIFVYAKSSGPCVRDLIQSSMRIRRIKSNIIYSNIDRMENNYVSSNLTYESVREHCDEVKKLNGLDSKDETMSSWFSKIYILCKLEQNLTAHCVQECFNYYYDILGYEQKYIDDYDNKLMIDRKDKDDTGTLYENIPNLFVQLEDNQNNERRVQASMNEYCEMMENNMIRGECTNIDKLRIRKYIFDRDLKQESQRTRRDYYNSFFRTPADRARFYKLRNEVKRPHMNSLDYEYKIVESKELELCNKMCEQLGMNNTQEEKHLTNDVIHNLYINTELFKNLCTAYGSSVTSEKYVKTLINKVLTTRGYTKLESTRVRHGEEREMSYEIKASTPIPSIKLVELFKSQVQREEDILKNYNICEEELITNSVA